ncbi:MAG: aryl-sulfate sulfotransferase [Candidatus Neomarinimicrobiota bacterium]|nr:aryl-sulfate sulfotransferase [Candidatus Neomarinimicrobiota bacterium]
MLIKDKYTILIAIFVSMHLTVFAGLVHPENNSLQNLTYIFFQWEQIPSAFEYQFQASTADDFSTTIINTSDNTLLYIDRENFEWGTEYFWHVKPIFNNGMEGIWSETFSFSTGDKRSLAETTVINQDQIADGLTVFGAFFNYFSAIIDRNGREIWNTGETDIVYYNSSPYVDLFGCYLNSGTENNLPGIVFSIDNEIVWEEPNDEFLHHDIFRLPNGNYMGIVSTFSLGSIPIGTWTPLFQQLGFQADGVTLEFPWIGDKLVEWDKDTKEVVWSWNTFDHFSMVDYDQYGGTWDQAYFDLQYDWTHVNAAFFSDEENALYISTRHLSRITKIDYESGDIIWNLGHDGPDMPSGDVTMGHDLGFSFQHGLQLTQEGHIVTFDNGNLSEIFLGTDEPVSRAIEIAVNGDDAELVWEYVLPEDLFGFASGNAQKLYNGNVLITTVGGGGTSLEVDSNGELVWEAHYNLSLPSGAVYRANRIPDIYPVAFSVVVHDLQTSNDQTGVFLSLGNVELTFELYNEGSYGETYDFDFFDDLNWFNDESGSVTLGTEDNTTISFHGNVSEISGINPLTLMVTPTHRPELVRTISVNAYSGALAIDSNPVPNEFLLFQPFPNPVNSSICIKFSAGNGPLELEIRDITGLFVETLVKGNPGPGLHEIEWNANNHPSGLYFIRLINNNQIETRKIIYLK